MDNIFLTQYLGNPPRSSKFIDQIDRVFRKTLPWIRIGSYWRGEMASIESRMNLFHLANLVLCKGVLGDFVEIGCHSGESTVILQKIIQEMTPERNLVAFDSFQGVPDVHDHDELVYKKGDMAASEELFNTNFEKVKLKKPITHAGWFEETLPIYLPDHIAFALLDADLYESTLFALIELYPRLSKGGICLLGVYCDPKIEVGMTTDKRYKSPGVKKACDKFFSDKKESISLLISGNYTSGYLVKG